MHSRDTHTAVDSGLWAVGTTSPRLQPTTQPEEPLGQDQHIFTCCSASRRHTWDQKQLFGKTALRTHSEQIRKNINLCISGQAWIILWKSFDSHTLTFTIFNDLFLRIPKGIYIRRSGERLQTCGRDGVLMFTHPSFSMPLRILWNSDIFHSSINLRTIFLEEKKMTHSKMCNRRQYPATACFYAKRVCKQNLWLPCIQPVNIYCY